ncbi:Multidrug resistance-associated protein [Blattamonas nauphoetae]|uniref:Multidrug resistance-associated protein n=1 Tax=Blattamonas nauphoetae TaxID=2049346 RepID=A0ABQ9XCP9_9EUKA|nr:Multidrug resistance-associated protein [Blattamonas nauphoetae]
MEDHPTAADNSQSEPHLSEPVAQHADTTDSPDTSNPVQDPVIAENAEAEDIKTVSQEAETHNDEPVVEQVDSMQKDQDEIFHPATSQTDPSIPVSPSIQHANDNMSTPTPSQVQPQPQPQPSSGKTEIKRKVNLEEKHNCFFNLFFCFYFPFICRCSPVGDSDIWECDSKDKAGYNIGRAEKQWDKPSAKYLAEAKEYEAEKTADPNTTKKPPKAPGLFSHLAFTIAPLRVILFYVGEIFSYGFMFLQPAMMKQVLKVVDAKTTNPNISFPYASAVLLILSPFFTNFFDANASRSSFHHCFSVRSMLCGLIYRKTLHLNITAQSNVDIGRLLSLVSTDCRNVGENLWMFYLITMVPLQVFVPLGFVIADFGWVALVAIGVIIVVTPISMIFMSFVGKYMTMYMSYNDERNKIMNETLQGMRVVKYSGMEQMFMDKIEVPREKQVHSIFMSLLFIQIAVVIIRNLPACVNAATLSVFIVVNKIPPERFASDVMPNLGFLTQMTREVNQFPMYIQVMIMVRISHNRIKQFLLLPELQQEVREEPEEADMMLSITDGNYRWADPPEIPMTMAELEMLRQEREKAKKTAAQKKAEAKEAGEESMLTGHKNQKKKEKNAESTPVQQTASNPEVEADMFQPNKADDDTVSDTRSQTSSVSSVGEDAGENTASDTETQKTPTPSLDDPKSESPSPSPSPTPTPTNSDKLTLRNVSLSLQKGSLTMVVGGVGCGKSSLGSAIIGDIERVSGEVRMRGSIAYCPQVPWINNDTVRGNIVFGSPFDEERYLNTVRVCALEADFKTLSAGDQTAIGEKGVNLSGGQKARIQLARSIYSERDIYVLDDPLSAVDAHVGRYLMEECICGVLKGKTVLLMTNQLQFLDRADNVVLLDAGNVVKQGKYSELREAGINFDKYMIKAKKREKKKAEEKKDEKGDNTESKTNLDDLAKGADSKAGKQILTEEEMETGGVAASNYFRFMATVFPIPGLILFIILYVGSELVPLFQSFWLGVIPNDAMFKPITYYWKIGIYAFMILVAIALFILRSFFMAYGNARSNRIIHTKLVSHVMHCPSSFFDTTPMGRIVNRFTGDLSQTDQMLLNLLLQIVSLAIGVVGQIVVVGVSTPFFLAIGLPALVVYYVVCILYNRASRNLQRLDSIARSPVLSLYSEIVNGAGLSTIRAFHLEDVWRDKYYSTLDKWSVVTLLFLEGKTWSAVYIGFITSLFMAGVVILGWISMSPPVLSVAINSAMTFGFLGTFLVMQLVEVEAKMTSYERINFYSTKLPQESTHASIVPPPDWPTQGEVVFSDVSFRYRSGLPFVLKNVDFRIQGGEKVGVCGRTGAGKSSILFALFRLIELNPKLEPKMIDIETGFPVDPDPNEEPNKGKVLIDGIDISEVERGRVRSSIAIIPQDPTLFTGTVRYNIELGTKCSEEKIWDVLDMVEMREVIAGLPAGLDTPVAEGGSNFSVGQRQLLCFARAIAKESRIVVLDEATASVDVETDGKIQRTIREQFKNKTVIVIAHRLNTILDSDKIMVMDKGSVAEFNSPEILKSNNDSALNALINSLNH